MKYLICQDWPNTTNNHAGIKYLCNYLEITYPKEFSAIISPDYKLGKRHSSSKIKHKICVSYLKFRYVFHMLKITISLIKKIKEGDSILFMEYMDLHYPQSLFAKIIRIKCPYIKLYGMIHLVPLRILSKYNKKDINRLVQPLDKIITLGHSLSTFFEDQGVPKDRIITSFHYVDSYYDRKKLDLHSKNVENKLSVIAMGNQMRNIDILKEVVLKNANCNFIICQGMNDMSSSFLGCENVELIPFVPEDILRDLMSKSDISLNVMIDTVGSNVIVTSMAMGLAMICSNVGSIKDYCSEENTIFCDNNDVSSFSDAIKKLSYDVDLLNKMKEMSYERSKRFSIENFYNFINIHLL